MSYRAMNRQCNRCGYKDEYLAHRDEDRGHWICPSTECGDPTALMIETFACPAILTSESASFLDGTKRPGFQSLRDANLEGKKHGRG